MLKRMIFQMDTPLAAAIHKENVHIGGEKATVAMKPDKTADKKRKASADPELVAGASKDVDLKQNFAVKDNEIKKNQMTQGNHHAAVVYRTDEEIRQCCELPNHIWTDEEIKQIRELSTNLIEKYYILIDEEIKQGHKLDDYEIYEEGHEDDWNEIYKLNPNLAEFTASVHGTPISNLEQPFLNDEEGYKTDSPDFNCSELFPGPDSFIHTPEELVEPFDDVDKFVKEIVLPELMLDDD